MRNVLTSCGEFNETWVTKMGSKIISKESWHLPTLVAGVMHNIEPAHHALQQGVEWIGGGKKSRKPITSVIKSDIILDFIWIWTKLNMLGSIQWLYRSISYQEIAPVAVAATAHTAQQKKASKLRVGRVVKNWQTSWTVPVYCSALNGRQIKRYQWPNFPVSRRAAIFLFFFFLLHKVWMTCFLKVCCSDLTVL